MVSVCRGQTIASVKLLHCGPTCLASTSRVMKKMKREIEPIVFRSLRTPGLEGLRKKKGDTWREMKTVSERKLGEK